MLAGMLVAAINQTSVTTVLPEIASDLHGLDPYTWVFTASMVASAIALPVFGKLSDLHGRRRLYIAGVSIFLAGAVACAPGRVDGAADRGPRGGKGVGMGAIMPLAMAILADVIPASERGSARRCGPGSPTRCPTSSRSGIPFMGVAFVACRLLRRDELSTVAAIRVGDELERGAADLVPIDPGRAPEAFPASRWALPRGTSC